MWRKYSGNPKGRHSSCGDGVGVTQDFLEDAILSLEDGDIGCVEM